jgi:hypothetical protein
MAHRTRHRALLLTGFAVAALAAGSVTANAAAPNALTVTSATELAPLVQNSHVNVTNTARDNGQSTGYGNSSVWIFDDTTLRNPDGFISNSGAITHDLNASDGITVTSDNPFTIHPDGTPQEIIPRTSAETAFEAAHSRSTGCTSATDPLCGSVFADWPGPVIADPARHRFLVTYGKLCRGSDPGTPCASDFVGQALGMGILSLDMRTHTETRLTETGLAQPINSVEGPDKTMLFTPAQAFGGGAAVVVDGMFYGYGDCQDTVCAVGRVPLAHIMDRSQWRYYTGDDAGGVPQWSTDDSKAVLVMQTGAAGGSVNWNPGMHAYLDIYMDRISGEAVYRTAPTPWGPWSDQQHMFNGAPTDTLWDYACFAHPEYQQNHGMTQYVTYYHPGDGQQHLVKVTFAGKPDYQHVLVPH